MHENKLVRLIIEQIQKDSETLSKPKQAMSRPLSGNRRP